MQPAISNGHFSSPFRATTTILSPRAQAALSSSREQPTPTVAGVSCFRSASKGRRRRQQRIEINRAGCPWQTDLDLATTRTRCLPQRREDTEGPLGRVNHCRPSSRLSYRCVCGGVVKVLVGKATWMIADAPGCAMWVFLLLLYSSLQRACYSSVQPCRRLVVTLAGGRRSRWFPPCEFMESRAHASRYPCPRYRELLKLLSAVANS